MMDANWIADLAQALGTDEAKLHSSLNITALMGSAAVAVLALFKFLTYATARTKRAYVWLTAKAPVPPPRPPAPPVYTEIGTRLYALLTDRSPDRLKQWKWDNDDKITSQFQPEIVVERKGRNGDTYAVRCQIVDADTLSGDDGRRLAAAAEDLFQAVIESVALTALPPLPVCTTKADAEAKFRQFMAEHGVLSAPFVGSTSVRTETTTISPKAKEDVKAHLAALSWGTPDVKATPPTPECSCPRCRADRAAKV